MFITIDGPDGVGKTTLAHNVVRLLNNKYNIKAIYTCEPTKSPKGKKIRDCLTLGGISKEDLLQLFLEDRKEHIEKEIIPLINDGYTVICDRYKYSTVCYQHLQGIPLNYLIKVNDFISPDISFILYMNYESIIERINKRGLEREIFEKEDIIKNSFELYSSMHEYFPNENIEYINAQKSLNELSEEIVQRIVKGRGNVYSHYIT